MAKTKEPGITKIEGVEIDAWLKRFIAYFIFEVKNSITIGFFLKVPVQINISTLYIIQIFEVYPS